MSTYIIEMIIRYEGLSEMVLHLQKYWPIFDKIVPVSGNRCQLAVPSRIVDVHFDGSTKSHEDKIHLLHVENSDHYIVGWWGSGHDYFIAQTKP